MKFTHKFSNFSFLLISAYLPPETSPWGRDANAFFDHVLQLMYTYHDCDAIFMLGDLNALVANMPDVDVAIDDIPCASRAYTAIM